MRSDSEWSDLAGALQRPEWLDDARFATRAARSEHTAELAHLLEAAFAEHPLDEWDRRFRDFTGCWGVMHTPAELPTHRQVAPNGFIAIHQTVAGQLVPIAHHRCTSMGSRPGLVVPLRRMARTRMRYSARSGTTTRRSGRCEPVAWPAVRDAARGQPNGRSAAQDALASRRPIAHDQMAVTTRAVVSTSTSIGLTVDQ